jgi:hypothetical protein
MQHQAAPENYPARCNSIGSAFESGPPHAWITLGRSREGSRFGMCLTTSRYFSQRECGRKACLQAAPENYPARCSSIGSAFESGPPDAWITLGRSREPPAKHIFAATLCVIPNSVMSSDTV